MAQVAQAGLFVVLLREVISQDFERNFGEMSEARREGERWKVSAMSETGALDAVPK